MNRRSFLAQAAALPVAGMLPVVGAMQPERFEDGGFLVPSDVAEDIFACLSLKPGEMVVAAVQITTRAVRQ